MSDLTFSLPPKVLDVIVEHVQARVEPAVSWRDLEGTARAFEVEERQVRQWREMGCPAKRVGKRLMFHLPTVEEWLGSR